MKRYLNDAAVALWYYITGTAAIALIMSMFLLAVFPEWGALLVRKAIELYELR